MEPTIKTGADAILYIGRQLHKDFNLDEPRRREIYEKAFYVFSGSEKALTLGMKPDKGLLMNGDLGVGKTTLMRVMQRLFKDTCRRFKWVSAKDIKDMLDEVKPAEIKLWYGKSLKCDLYLDDIGVGQATHNNYGNQVNLIGELIMDRYELYVSDGFKTHLSTNLLTDISKDQRELTPGLVTVKDLYGDRVLDRMVEMTNLISWTGKSLRR